MRKTTKRRAMATIAVSVSLVLSTGTPNFAQSVADAARQERERKRILAQHAPHVYTNEDLSKAHILAPEDEARVAARQNESVGTGVAATAEAVAPQAAPQVPLVPIAVPDIGDVASDAYLPDPVGVPANMALPVDVSKTPPQVVSQRPQQEIAAPTIAAQTPIVVLPASPNAPANILLPTTVSKPLAKEASNRAQTQQPTPAAEISLPDTTMPFATQMGYGPKIALPANVSTPLVKEATNRVQGQAPAAGTTVPATPMPFAAQTNYGPKIALPANVSTPLVKDATNRVQNQAPAAGIPVPATPMPFATSVAYGPAYGRVEAPIAPSVAKERARESSVASGAPVVAVPVAAPVVRLTLTEHSIVRPPAEPAKSVEPATSKVSVTAPGEVLVRTEVRPDVAKPATDPAAGVFEPNRSQAIADITGRVKVVPGDSLWKLAVRYFGNGLRWKRLATLNPQLSDPNRIRVGEWIQIPSERKQSAKHLVVQPGDTMGKSLNPS